MIQPQTASALVVHAHARWPSGTTGVTVYRLDQGRLLPIAANDVSRHDGLAPRPLGIGAAGRAAAERAPVLLADYQREVQGATPAARAGVCCAMAVPIVRGAQVLAAVAVGTDDSAGRFTAADLAGLIALVGTSVGAPMSVYVRTTHLAGLEALYDAHGRQALAFASAFLPDPARAEAAVEDALLAVWRAGLGEEPSPAATWHLMVSVLRRTVGEHLQARRTPR